ncbi:hypothetical protein HMPREF0765_4395 [Sphingobacterium spiritivorum ATCC 33300]|uniref:Uncharacterized protein n=1 Tax=Sphingobacterium spiritivorum ATCC 33300 TaxID=525372 RepID=C2G4A9_SPHSI|nr:hypothetical protein HMPREF0765_4395 [Sphingobacterium spiritivorum ATCC 33300]
MLVKYDVKVQRRIHFIPTRKYRIENNLIYKILKIRILTK